MFEVIMTIVAIIGVITFLSFGMGMLVVISDGEGAGIVLGGMAVGLALIAICLAVQ